MVFITKQKIFICQSRELQKKLNERKERGQTDLLVIGNGKLVKDRDGTKTKPKGQNVRGVQEKVNQTQKEKETGV